MISVLLPTYNYARYLPQAIESVLAQTDADFELVIRDDASSDDSVSIIDRYAKRDGRIRWARNPSNIGMVQNWNACLAEAKGQYIKFLFGDDCLTRRDALSTWARSLDRYPQATMAAAARLVIDPSSRVQTVWDEFPCEREFEGTLAIGKSLWENRNLIGEPSAVMFRRAAGTENFDVSLRQIVDLEMWYRLLMRGSLVYLKQPLCAFRQHDQQQTQTNRLAGIGALESLAVAARYLPDLPPHSISAWKRRQIAFRTLYYSRKRNPRTGEIERAERALDRLLTPSQFAGCWALHRLRRPLQNLRTKIARLCSRDQMDPAAQGWVPLQWTAYTLASEAHVSSP